MEYQLLSQGLAPGEGQTESERLPQNFAVSIWNETWDSKVCIYAR